MVLDWVQILKFLFLPAASSAAGAIIVLICIFLIFFFRKDIHEAIFFWNKEHEDDRDVEKFLKNYGSIVPKRYHYSDLMKMTNTFKDKLGQEGFGGAFKGKLQGGRLVAVKVLSNSKCNGEDFVNKVRPAPVKALPLSRKNKNGAKG